MDLFTERFLPLIQESGKSDQELEKAMGLPRSIIYDWKHGRNKSSFKKYAGNFAEYFNVSADYLLGNTDRPQNNNAPETDPQTVEAINLFANMSSDKRKLALKIIKVLLDED